MKNQDAVFEAETAALGAAMLSHVAAAHVVGELTAQHFVRDAHATVFNAIVRCHSEGPVDQVTVTSELGLQGRLDEVGGPVAVSQLAQCVPNPAAVRSYCDAVKDFARRRHAILAAKKFVEQVDTAADVSQLVEDLAINLTASASRKGTVDPDDVMVDFYRRLADEELVKAYKTGWQFDDLYRLPEGMLTVVTGLPGSGKSTFLDALIWRVCERDPDFKVTFFSPEQGPPGKHLFHLVWTKLGRTPKGHADSDEVEAARVWWQERVDWIDDDKDNTISDVLAIARVKASQGTRLLVVDPYNNLSPDWGVKFDRTDLEIREMLRRLKRFGRETGCAVVVVAHPRQTQTAAGTDAVFAVPTAAHIAGGQEWWNHADAIVTVWRNQSGELPDVYGDKSQVKLVVQKVRDAGVWGRQGTGMLVFDEVKRRFFDVASSGVSPV